jgi:hypothetical protein
MAMNVSYIGGVEQGANSFAATIATTELITHHYGCIAAAPLMTSQLGTKLDTLAKIVCLKRGCQKEAIAVQEGGGNFPSYFFMNAGICM